MEQVKCRKCQGKFENSALVFNRHLQMCLDCVDVWTTKMDKDRNFIKQVLSDLDKLHSEMEKEEQAALLITD